MHCLNRFHYIAHPLNGENKIFNSFWLFVFLLASLNSATSNAEQKKIWNSIFFLSHGYSLAGILYLFIRELKWTQRTWFSTNPTSGKWMECTAIIACLSLTLVSILSGLLLLQLGKLLNCWTWYDRFIIASIIIIIQCYGHPKPFVVAYFCLYFIFIVCRLNFVFIFRHLQ